MIPPLVKTEIAISILVLALALAASFFLPATVCKQVGALPWVQACHQ
jgi:hypothetical protein